MVILSDYYDQNYLKPNPHKTLDEHNLRNREAKRKLNIHWVLARGQIDHVENPKYLGVKLNSVLKSCI